MSKKIKEEKEKEKKTLEPLHPAQRLAEWNNTKIAIPPLDTFPPSSSLLLSLFLLVLNDEKKIEVKQCVVIFLRTEIQFAVQDYRYGIHKASHCARFIGFTALAIASMTVWFAGKLPDGLCAKLMARFTMESLLS